MNSTKISAVWRQPKMSHGEVTNYRLFVDEQEVYYGLNKRTEVDGLLPYKFVLINTKNIKVCEAS